MATASSLRDVSWRAAFRNSNVRMPNRLYSIDRISERAIRRGADCLERDAFRSPLSHETMSCEARPFVLRKESVPGSQQANDRTGNSRPGLPVIGDRNLRVDVERRKAGPPMVEHR